jgi:BirA family biotin operon repressor/biotin-[acetyl-CoA-carboxylase] ligase
LVKEKILNRLRRRGPVSGEELGRAIGISRTAVWKHIKELRREGYRIDSVPSKGYYFISAPDSLLPDEIRAGLNTRVLGQEITYLREVASTQETAKSLAAQGAKEGTVAIAETQSGGRGRIGRAWSSPPGGIYFSIILRPDIKPAEALRLPLIAGVAVARAIEKLTDLTPKLKWPNDIIVKDRKTGGILTEMSAEVDRLDWVIIGIGLNVNTPQESFPSEVEGIATSLMEAGGKHIPRVRLLQHILAELESLYHDFGKYGFEPIREQWKSFSNTIGADVIISSATGQTTGLAVDIDSDGALILQKDDGTQERIIAGDVSLKKALNG